jgi:hypothetical protein
MRAIRGARASGIWWVHGAVIAAALLTLATGFCLFDQDDHGAAGHVSAPDLCSSIAATSLVVVFLAGLLPLGWAVSPLGIPVRVVACHVPDPPPKFALSR